MTWPGIYLLQCSTLLSTLKPRHHAAHHDTRWPITVLRVSTLLVRSYFLTMIIYISFQSPFLSEIPKSPHPAWPGLSFRLLSRESVFCRQALRIFVQAQRAIAHPFQTPLQTFIHEETMMLYAINRMLPDNKTQILEPSSISTASSPTITSLNPQQKSQWGPSDIGTVVFGCVASVLGILALWMMFWLRQREPGHTTSSGMLSALHS